SGGIWCLETGRRVCAPAPGERSLGLDAGRRLALILATASKEVKEVKVCDARTGKEVCRCPLGRPGGVPPDLEQLPWQLSPDGTCLAVLSQGLLRVWDLEGNRAVLSVAAPGH